MTGSAGGAPPRVALIGANGHGLWHRRIIAGLHDAGRLELVGLVDVRPVEAAPDAPIPPGAGVFTEHRRMLAETRPDVVIICTPPHTHLPIALDALAAGADLLLEKPPVLSLDQHRTLAAALRRANRVCQVGFQALGSVALRELTSAVVDGRLGTITGISTVASWQRTDGYYARAPWAGRRSLDGRPVLDGVLANPLAHALMQCLAVAESAISAGVTSGAGGTGTPPSWPAQIELEHYRVRPIEVDDTASLRVTLGGGLPVVAAVTLAGEEFIAGEVIVHGSTGRAVLEYPTDRLLLPGDAALRDVPGRTVLLENLLAHRADPAGVPLIAPLSRTAGFTAVIEAIHAAPEPVLLAEDRLVTSGTGPDRVHSVRGVNAVLRRAASELALLSETGVPWAVKPHRAAVAAEPTDG